MTRLAPTLAVLLAVALPPAAEAAWEVAERDGVVIAGTTDADGNSLGVFCTLDTGNVRVSYRPDAVFPTTKLMDVEVRFGGGPAVSGLWEAADHLLVTDDIEQVEGFVAGALRSPQVTMKPAGLPARSFSTEGFVVALRGMAERCKPTRQRGDLSL